MKKIKKGFKIVKTGSVGTNAGPDKHNYQYQLTYCGMAYFPLEHKDTVFGWRGNIEEVYHGRESIFNIFVQIFMIMENPTTWTRPWLQ